MINLIKEQLKKQIKLKADNYTELAKIVVKTQKTQDLHDLYRIAGEQRGLTKALETIEYTEKLESSHSGYSEAKAYVQNRRL